MGTITLDEYRQEVRVALGLAIEDETAPDAIITRMVNQAARSLTTVRDWPWLYREDTTATVVDQEWLDLPTDATRVLYVQVEALDLTPATPRDLRRSRSERGWPSAYFVDLPEEKIIIAPVPDTVRDALIGYYTIETTLSADNDTLQWPDEYSDWLVYEAAVRVAIRTNNTERLVSLRDEAGRQRADVIDNVRKAGAPARIRRTKASYWQDVN